MKMYSIAFSKISSQLYFNTVKRFLTVSSCRFSAEIIDPPEELKLDPLNYEKRRNDPYDIKKARLLYQSRKRGNLENGIILSTFAAEYLSKMSKNEMDEYDKIINLPSNDWDIYYWAMGMKPVPEEFDNSVMKLLKHHVKHVGRNAKIGQPPL